MKTRHAHSTDQGFTLIELLVVISIISLLIAILLPALGAARKRSNQIKCASTIKHVGNAIMMYSMDFGDWIPNGTPVDVSDRWYIALPRLNYLNGDKAMICPEGQDYKSTDYDSHDYRTNIGINNCLSSGIPSGDSSVKQRRFRDVQETLKGPTRTPLCMDASNNNWINHMYSYAGTNLYTDATPPANIASRHIGSANILFADMHAKSIEGPFAPTYTNVRWLNPDTLANPDYIRY